MVRDLVIWGLHRSGTSALARCLDALGWRFGNPNVTPTAQNPGGFYEHYQLVEINERLLSDIGTAWDDWSFDPGGVKIETPERTALARAAADLLWRLGVAADGPWAIKDPRMAILAEFWLPLLDAQIPACAHVFIYRDPSEVVRSLETRAMEGVSGQAGLFPRDAAFAAWRTQTIHLLRALSGREVLMIRHEDIIERPNEVLGRIASFTGLFVGTDQIDSAAALVDVRLYRARNRKMTGACQSGPEMDLYVALDAQPRLVSDFTRIAGAVSRMQAPTEPAVRPVWTGPAERDADGEF